jgi:putative transposase
LKYCIGIHQIFDRKFFTILKPLYPAVLLLFSYSCVVPTCRDTFGIFTQPMKTSYHPAITVAFYLNCLPTDLVQYIPRSTRFDWQHKDKSTYFGYEWFCQNQQLFQTLKQVSTNKKLLQINIALIRVIAIKRFISKYALQMKDKLFQVPETVIKNISKVSSVFSLANTLRFLQLPYSAYLKLKQKARCGQSPLNLCRIIHPAQFVT